MRSLSAILLAILSLSPAGSVGHAATEYLVVTTDALAPSFQHLADARTAGGFETEVITVEDLVTMTVPGRDVPEQIRTYIQGVYAQGSLRYVVLGGDVGQVPTRFAYSDFYIAAGPEIATDLYFAALDGDWDADGDGVFGEVDVDAADLYPEIAVGRVPANSAAEATAFVAKLAEYEDPVNAGHRDSALFLGEVLFPNNWSPGVPISLDGAEICEDVRSTVAAAPQPWDQRQLYENETAFPGSSHLDLVESLDHLDSGEYGLVFHIGHGWETSMSVGDATIGPADALALTNGPNHFVLITEVPGGAAFHNDAILEDFVRNPNGGAIATIGWSHTSFASAAAAFLDEFSNELFFGDQEGIGESLNEVRRARAADAQANTVWRVNQLAINLLGDPSLEVQITASITRAPAAGRIRLHSVAPNPFNPQVTISFEVIGDPGAALPVGITVFDLAGRKMRSLGSGALRSGPYDVVWDGRSDSGVNLASGVYVIAIESGTTRLTAKAVLLK